MRVRITGEIVLLLTIIFSYILINLTSVNGSLAYILPSLFWILIGFFSIKLYGLDNIRLKFNRALTLVAALTAFTQIVALMFIGLLTTFGRSPYNSSFNSFILTLLFFSSNLFGIELARAQLVRVIPRNKKLIGLAMTSVFLTLTSFSFARYSSLNTPLETVEFLGSFLIPLFAMNILASYLALLGGPIASVAYLGMIQLFECVSPILPNPHWTIKALVTTVTPVIGFLAVNEVVKPFTLLRHGLITRKEAKMVTSKPKNSLPVGWMTIAVAALFLFWGNSGLLGFQPSVIMSGSMQPLYQVGDMEIIFNVKPASIGVGDVIQYRGTDAPIIHRVIDIYTHNGGIWFKTKGDANNVPDPNPVSESQVMGKAVFTIPKLGWASIYLKQAFSSVYNKLTDILGNLGGV